MEGSFTPSATFCPLTLTVTASPFKLTDAVDHSQMFFTLCHLFSPAIFTPIVVSNIITGDEWRLSVNRPRAFQSNTSSQSSSSSCRIQNPRFSIFVWSVCDMS